MLFMITYDVLPGNRNEVNRRFIETGGPPPSGVKMAGRWVSPGGKGFCLAESDNLLAVGKWIQQWSDLIQFDITPVLVDEEVAEMIQST